MVAELKCDSLSVKGAFNDYLLYSWSSRSVYYSVLDHFVKRSQYISIKISLHKQSENPWVWY